MKIDLYSCLIELYSATSSSYSVVRFMGKHCRRNLMQELNPEGLILNEAQVWPLTQALLCYGLGTRLGRVCAVAPPLCYRVSACVIM